MSEDSNVLYYPVMYLDDNDFQGDELVLPNDMQNQKDVVVMFQTSWCPHCTTAKPDFQEFAEKYQNEVFCATVQADGDTQAEKTLGKRVNEIIPGFRGFPDYCIFVKGKRVNKQIKDRSIQGLIEFANV
jgi:thiol-disulfide isomerase/thioredoxin